MPSPTISRVLAVIAVAVVTVGCASPVRGGATRDPDPNPDTPNPALLDPGGYPTTPRAPLGNAETMVMGRHLEALRLAEVIAIPFEVDSAFTDDKNPALPLADPFKLDEQFLRPLGKAAARHDFLAGYLTSGSQKSFMSNYLINALLRFPTPEDAAAAAIDLGAATERDAKAAAGSVFPTLVPLAIPEHPDTTAVISEKTPTRSWSTLYAYTARGPFVLAQQINIDTAEKAVALMGRVIEVQTDMLTGFEPTPVDRLVDLPIDPDGLLARTLPAGSLTNDPDQGIYGSHGALTWLSQPDRQQELFGKTGMQSMAKALVNVYQARDPQGAQAIVDAFAAEVAANNFSPAGPMAGLPGARCAISPPSPVDTAINQSVRCLAAVERYAVSVHAVDETDAHQQMAAQYLMLTAS